MNRGRREALAAISSAVLSPFARGADRVRIGIIGCGTRGNHHLDTLLNLPNAQIMGLCDVYQPSLKKAAEKITPSPQLHTDYRQLLEHNDIDAVFIATPHHWHAQMAIDACNAQRDVYLEKPLADTIENSRAIVDAVRKNHRIMQVGLQQRSMPHYQAAAKLVHSGLLGNVTHAVMTMPSWTLPPESPVASPPPDLDWELFQGPAPRRPYRQSRMRRWLHYPEYAGFSFTDGGVHMFDVVNWYLRPEPSAIDTFASSAILRRPADERAPDTFAVTWKYPKFMMTFANWTPVVAEGEENGNYFYGDRGILFINRDGYWARPIPRTQDPFEPCMVRTKDDYPSIRTSLKSHIDNFLACVQTRRDPLCPVELGFDATLPGLLGLLAMRGRPVRWDASQVQVA
jgi:predicted dehydrogenase